MVTTADAQTVECPACQSPAYRPCTQPTNTGRLPVTWVHKSRELAWQARQRQDFYLVFGIEFNEKPHPYWPECNPKGWVRITAPTYEQARDKALARFGQEWSSLIPKANFNARLFPAGELMVLP
jgi:hypothetical protein